MGRGNVCVHGEYEGLFYIDNDDIHVYRNDLTDEPQIRLMRNLSYPELTGGEWQYDEWETADQESDILECFIDDFTRMYPSFERSEPNQWLGNTTRVILESKLFYIGLEDNQWSVAVKLLQKEEPWGLVWMNNLQGRLYHKYLDGVKTCLLNRLPSIGTYGGAWTHGIIENHKHPVGVR